MRTRSLVCGLLVLMAVNHAYAWGAVGHRITGHVATQLLTPTARLRVQQLTGTDDLSILSTYMDDEKWSLSHKLHGSPQWHYDNRPVCERMLFPVSFCRDGNCSTVQIERWQGVLQSRFSSNEDKHLAILILVHLIGDEMQPLHESDNHDRGGNDVTVVLPGRSRKLNLHSAWDTEFVKKLVRGHSEELYATQLLNDYRNQIPTWQKGNVKQWSDETYGIAKEFAYGALPHYACNWDAPDVGEIPQSYVDRAESIIPTQLAKAAARIAVVLNAALK